VRPVIGPDEGKIGGGIRFSGRGKVEIGGLRRPLRADRCHVRGKREQKSLEFRAGEKRRENPLGRKVKVKNKRERELWGGAHE